MQPAALRRRSGHGGTCATKPAFGLAPPQKALPLWFDLHLFRPVLRGHQPLQNAADLQGVRIKSPAPQKCHNARHNVKSQILS